MRTISCLVLLLALVSVGAWAALPPGVAIEKVWSEKDGLSHASVRAVAAGDGFVYVGTDRGLTIIKPDGTTAVWNKDNSPLLYQQIPALVLRGKELWTTCRNPVAGGGTFRWDGFQWSIFEEIKDDMQSNYVNCFHVDKAGKLWLGTDNQGLNSYDYETNPYKKFGYLATKKGLIDMRVTCIDSRAGELWIGTIGGISVYRGKDGEKYLFTNYDQQNGLPYSTVTSIAVGPTEVYAGSSMGLMRFDGTSWKQLGVAEGLAEPWVTGLAMDGPVLWVSTKKGLQQLVNGRFTDPIGLTDGLPSTRIQCLHVSRQPSGAKLYVGTDRGLAVLRVP